MKTKTYILTFFIFFSGVVFGQKEYYDFFVEDSTFMEFTKKVYSLERSFLNIKPIEPTDIIEIKTYLTNTSKKFKLKYIHKIGSPPTFDEAVKEKFKYSSYWIAEYGTDFIIIGIFAHTGSMNDVKYYYEIIRKEDEKFLNAKITTYNLNDTIVPIKTNVTEFKDYGNDIENNLSLINHLDLLNFALYSYELQQDDIFDICCSGCFEARAMPPSYRTLQRNDKGNFLKISNCYYTPTGTEFSFKYNSSDKLSEIKTEEYLYKIEWLSL